MGAEKLAYGGRDDAGEMSAWYVLTPLFFSPPPPADAEYIISVPLFDKVSFSLPENTFTIVKKGNGKKIDRITYGDETIDGYFIDHDRLKQGKTLTISTR